MKTAVMDGVDNRLKSVPIDRKPTNPRYGEKGNTLFQVRHLLQLLSLIREDNEGSAIAGARPRGEHHGDAVPLKIDKGFIASPLVGECLLVFEQLDDDLWVGIHINYVFSRFVSTPRVK